MNNSFRKEIFAFVENEHGTLPEYLFDSMEDCAVLRHRENNKWYGVIMNISRIKLGLEGDGNIDIINLKCDPVIQSSLIMGGGVYPAYHMNKKLWISVLLDGSVEMDQIIFLIEMSYELTNIKKINKDRNKKTQN